MRLSTQLCDPLTIIPIENLETFFLMELSALFEYHKEWDSGVCEGINAANSATTN